MSKLVIIWKNGQETTYVCKHVSSNFKTMLVILHNDATVIFDIKDVVSFCNYTSEVIL